jgi:hypothetical protein
MQAKAVCQSTTVGTGSRTIETGQLRLLCVARKVSLPNYVLKWRIVPTFLAGRHRYILVLVDCSNIIDEEAVFPLCSDASKPEQRSTTTLIFLQVSVLTKQQLQQRAVVTPTPLQQQHPISPIKQQMDKLLMTGGAALGFFT